MVKNDKIPALIVAIVAIAGLVMNFSGGLSGFGVKSFDQVGYGEGYRIPGTTWDEGYALGFQSAQACIDSGLEWTECCHIACAWESEGDTDAARTCTTVCRNYGPAFASGR